jgi:hypothetical protein
MVDMRAYTMFIKSWEDIANPSSTPILVEGVVPAKDLVVACPLVSLA